MKGEKFTAENPTPKPGKRTDVFGHPIPDEFFENESDEAAVLKSEAIAENSSPRKRRRSTSFSTATTAPSTISTISKRPPRGSYQSHPGTTSL